MRKLLNRVNYLIISFSNYQIKEKVNAKIINLANYLIISFSNYQILIIKITN